MKFYNNLVEYFANNVLHAAFVACISILLIVALLAVLMSGLKQNKKNKAAKSKAKAKSATPATSKPVTAAKPAPAKTAPAPVKTTPAPVKPAPVETKPAPAPVAEKTAPVEEKPAPVEEKSAPAVAPVEEKVETVKAVEETPAVEPVVETPVVEETPAVEPVVETPVAEEIAVAETAPTLHDELKDVDTAISFYEEDASDQEARYKGKWVICRLVTEDKSEDEMYFFELHASNGEKLLTSEEYTTYQGAIRGIQTHKNNILKGNFRITVSKRGEYIFKLLSGKNMLLCLGEGYATKARCESAIESAKRFAQTAIIDENLQYQVVKVPVEDNSPIEPLKEGTKGKWIIDCTVAPDGNEVYTFELFANNGERLLSSEEYTTYVGAVNGIQTHKQNIQKGNFRIVLSKRGDYVYKLLNSNNQLLCLGEHYKTKRLCQNAVESVKRFALNSPVLANPNIKK